MASWWRSGRARGGRESAAGSVSPPVDADALREEIRRLELELADERDLRQRLEEQTKAAPDKDPVTGLANAVRFHDRLTLAVAHALRQKHKFAVAHVSLDGFDALAARLGPGRTDDLLRGAAVALEGALRQGDTVARLRPGDAFTVLLPGIDHDEDVTVIAEKLRLALRGPSNLGGSRLITASIGIAVFPEDGSEAETLLHSAAVAMQRARDRGGDAWDVHAPSSRARAARRMVRETALRQAMARDELALFWRPVLACGTRSVVGLEAVLRWRGVGRSAHPGDFVSPRDVPNLAVPLGQWLLRSASREAMRWRGQPGLPPVSVHVGLSGRQLAHSSLLDLVRRALDESGLPPASLRFSIGQRDLHAAFPVALERLSMLRQLGIQIALQGFGTGESRLRDPFGYPLDAIQIDASVVSGAPAVPEYEAVVTAVIALAHARGLQVLADGADAPLHAGLLARLGCDHMQGRACGLPMPAPDAEPWLRARGGGPAARGASVPAGDERPSTGEERS